MSPFLKKEKFRQEKLLKKISSIKFKFAFTSNLIRAQQTLHIILKTNELKFIQFQDTNSKKEKKWNLKYKSTSADKLCVNVIISKCLNERYYGDLQGLNKEKMIKKFGEEKVRKWRRSFTSRPPNGEKFKRYS